MAILNINPTRSAFQEIKGRIKQAERGHKLLKDKQDGLMKEFMAVVREARTLRSDIEDRLSKAFGNLLMAGASVDPRMIQNALLGSTAKADLSVSVKNVMSVAIPQLNLSISGSAKNYGYLQTPADLDTALETFQEILPDLTRLSEIEKTVETMAKEIEITRRRVNSLEHMLIPDLKDTRKYIKMKLDENERAQIITVMKVKAMQEEPDG